jgi:hypothetical protein
MISVIICSSFPSLVGLTRSCGVCAFAASGQSLIPMPAQERDVETAVARTDLQAVPVGVGKPQAFQS